MKSSFKILTFFFSILIIFSITPIKVKAISDVDWLLLKENAEGKEWLDKGSIKRLKNHELSVLTKFFKREGESEDQGETKLYVMRINCDNKEFKDTSINGIPNFNAQWKNSNNDELIDIIIEKSCSELDL